MDILLRHLDTIIILVVALIIGIILSPTATVDLD